MVCNRKTAGFELILIIALSILCTVRSVYGNVGITGNNSEGASRYVLLEEKSSKSISLVRFPFEKDYVSMLSKEGANIFLMLDLFDGYFISENRQNPYLVNADGKKLNPESGFCPTNPDYRKLLRETIVSWDKDFIEQNKIAGLFLEHVHYPLPRSASHTELAESCYCDRCVTLFQAETGIKIPGKFKSPRDKSIWLNTFVPYEWMEWRKLQIVSIVREVRELLDPGADNPDFKLGLFLVPWKKSEFDGALSFSLAQDPVLLEPYVDVFALKIENRMVSGDLDHVGDITRYFRKMIDKELWPIIPLNNDETDEFEAVVDIISEADADGLLISDSNLNEDNFKIAFTLFEERKNFIGNAHFSKEKKKPEPGNSHFLLDPSGWSRGNREHIIDSRFTLTEPDKEGISSIGLTGGADREARWTQSITPCAAGEKYRFSAEFFRHDLSDNSAYPKLRVWGQSYLLNTHRMAGSFQKLGVDVECPDTGEPGDNLFIFENPFVGSTFWMRNPRLVKKARNHINIQEPPELSFFPIGLYGVNRDNIRLAKASGVNSAIVGLNRENLKVCIDNDIHCTLSVPREPEKLIVELDGLAPFIEKGSFSFYVNDEPGIHSFPTWQAADIQKIIKNRFPDRFTNMAVVRPQVIMDYQDGADYFMMDQYPIPNMPMTWLTDSLDQAAAVVGGKRLQAVIQAFGGEQYANGGWPRPPSYEEMNCLAFLAVVHGARGLYFYTYPSISSTVQSMDDFQKVVRRLNSMRSWLLQENEPETPAVRMLSENKVDARGRPAVHCTRKTQYDTQMLICANAIKTYVEAEFTVPESSRQEWQEYFDGEDYYVVDGTIRSRFKPYEVKVLFERQ